jgi:hypothetical protein
MNMTEDEYAMMMAEEENGFEPEDADLSLCLGRLLVSKDTRFKPVVYKTGQCQRKPVAGSTLCSFCAKRKEKCESEEMTDPAKAGWNGIVTEDAPEWAHVLGTAWALKCRLVESRDSADEAGLCQHRREQAVCERRAAAARTAAGSAEARHERRMGMTVAGSAAAARRAERGAEHLALHVAAAAAPAPVADIRGFFGR